MRNLPFCHYLGFWWLSSSRFAQKARLNADHVCTVTRQPGQWHDTHFTSMAKLIPKKPCLTCMLTGMSFHDWVFRHTALLLHICQWQVLIAGIKVTHWSVHFNSDTQLIIPCLTNYVMVSHQAVQDLLSNAHVICVQAAQGYCQVSSLAVVLCYFFCASDASPTVLSQVQTSPARQRTHLWWADAGSFLNLQVTKLCDALWIQFMLEMVVSVKR